jgi:hypothetical protein
LILLSHLSGSLTKCPSTSRATGAEISATCSSNCLMIVRHDYVFLVQVSMVCRSYHPILLHLFAKICVSVCLSVCRCVHLSLARLGFGTTNAIVFIWKNYRLGEQAHIRIGIRICLKLLRIVTMGTGALFLCLNIE